MLDTPREERFELITKLAIKIFTVPISTLTLVDKEREWFKSCQGLENIEGERAISFCGHALLADETLVVEDTLTDERFKDNPMVVGSPFIRFYAGIPIFSLDGQRVGVMCIKDIKPKKLSEVNLYLLKAMTSWAEIELNLVKLQEILARYKNGTLADDDAEKLRGVVSRIVEREVEENLKSLIFAIEPLISDKNSKDEYRKSIKNILELINCLKEIVKT